MKTLKHEMRELKKCGKFDVDRHHRLQKCNGGGDDEKNISIVSKLHHRCFHILFRNMSTEEIAECLNRTWIDPSKQFIVIDKPS